MNTNKRIILLVMLILLNCEVVAQRFNAGIAVGFVSSDVYGADIVPDADEWNNIDFHKAGFMFGTAVTSMLKKNLSLRLEINYVQKGTQQPADSTGNGFYKFSFNYAEIPLILKYRFHFGTGKKSIKGFDVHAGVSAGRLIKSKAQGDNFYSVDDYSYLNRTDVSLQAGLGYTFFDRFNFSFRYSNSIIPVFKRLGSPLFFTQAFNYGNNIVFHFILQYMFGSEKKYSTPLINNEQPI